MIHAGGQQTSFDVDNEKRAGRYATKVVHKLLIIFVVVVCVVEQIFCNVTEGVELEASSKAGQG
jgi:hypothetical protein